MTRAIFFDIFGTLVDWRGTLIHNIKKNMVFEKNDSFIELLVINWRLEYQPILDKVNKNKIPWMLLDDLHLISLNTVLKKMKVKNITEEKKKELVFLWHKLEPWKDSSKYLKLLGRKYVTSSLSNGNISLQKNLFKYANLDFNFILSAENFKKYKPDPLVYLGAASILGFKPNDCTLVASHKSDLQAADKVGYNTIYIRRPNEYGIYSNKFKENTFTPNLSINSLEDLLTKHF